MDFFVGTVDASAETTMLQGTDTGDSTDEVVVAGYLRPAAVNSEYLDTAVSTPRSTRQHGPPASRAQNREWDVPRSAASERYFTPCPDLDPRPGSSNSPPRHDLQ